MSDRAYRMTLRQPATRWEDALPSGNGSLGALVYGNIRREVVLLNHEELWLRTPRPELPGVSHHLPELRALLASGRYREAVRFLDSKLREHRYAARPDPYHPAFDLELEQETRGAFTAYRRGLDFATGEIVVTWTDEETQHERRLFVSRADDVVVLCVRASRPSAVSGRLGLAPHDLSGLSALGWPKGTDPAAVPIHFEVEAEEGWIRLRARYERCGEYAGLARVAVAGGRMEADGRALRVSRADGLLVLLALSAPEEAGPAAESLRAKLAALPADYDALLARHAPLHGEAFRRMRLDLDAAPGRERTNEDLLANAYDGEVPTALIERVFDMGRYLLLSSSAPGGLPANLQGVWNGDYDPAWASDYHNDENIQMNYWQALPGNLPETTLPYFDYYERWLEDYRTNARKVYGCRGILSPIAQSTHGLIHEGAWINWTAGAGWLAQLFYDYWLFTGDREFLRDRAVPFLKEVALFYEDFLFEGPDGALVFSPSLSPENVPAAPEASLACTNATMDVAIAREVLGNLCAACGHLGIEPEGVARWRAMLAKLPAYEVNADGALREWLAPGLADNYHHRHQSHLYPVFPGFEVTPESAPELFEAARVAVEKRLVVGLASQTGWSLAHMANIYARLGDGDRALECLELLARSCLGLNLFTYHNDWRCQGITLHWGYHRKQAFQIDANLGCAAAVLEMLVFSAPGLVKLLPALPSKWCRGRAEGIRCRGGVEVCLRWDLEARRLDAALRSATDQPATVKLPHTPVSLECTVATAAESPLGLAYRVLHLRAGEAVRLVAGW